MPRYLGIMSLATGDFHALLASAVGDDQHLANDLRVAVVESARHHLTLLSVASSDDGWVTAARRLKGLATSFGLDHLSGLVGSAIDNGASDPRILGQIAAQIETL